MYCWVVSTGVPDLLFFGESHTTLPVRSVAFQAQCVAALMGAHGSGESCVVLYWGLLWKIRICEMGWLSFAF
ncbi:hypothetical protein MtrunA17_Chr6g0470351 [Medicago truncatula]|uniref:Uncharacterized protein n=1 Tax=Medicago truncatula TaxID=3880 RepID=A0A396HE34_MEDTR|nr:hypothetical protein MtrunA17_Chr6g0470351 [Medicago truncatula]